MQESVKELSSKKSRLTEQEQALVNHQKKVESHIASALQDQARTQHELQNLDNERLRIEKTEIELNEKLSSTLNQLMEAKLDQRESEKEQKLKETLSSLKRIFLGVHGRVTDLCKPTQRKYDAAISVILGRHMDAIIVDRQKTAIDCIQLLREQRSGHATFLPLDTLSAKPVNDRLRSVAKGARLAVDVVQYDEVLETAIHYVCGNALVCDTMEVAKHVCYDLGHQVKAVALDGTVFHKSGLITGGQSGLGSSVRRWDEKVVDDLKRRRDTMMAQLNELSKTKKRGEDGETLRSELAGIESKLAFAREDLSATKRNIGEIREQIQLINTELAEKGPKAEKSARDLADREVEISRIDAQIHKIEDEVFASLCRKIGVANIREYEELKLKRSQELSEKRSKFETVLSKMRNQLSFETRQLDETKERLSRLENMIATETTTLDKYEAQRDEIHAQQAAIQKEMESLKKELDAAQAAYQTRSEKVSAFKKQVSQKNKQVDALMKDIGAKVKIVFFSCCLSLQFRWQDISNTRLCCLFYRNRWSRNWIRSARPSLDDASSSRLSSPWRGVHWTMCRWRKWRVFAPTPAVRMTWTSTWRMVSLLDHNQCLAVRTGRLQSTFRNWMRISARPCLPRHRAEEIPRVPLAASICSDCLCNLKTIHRRREAEMLSQWSRWRTNSWIACACFRKRLIVWHPT